MNTILIIDDTEVDIMLARIALEEAGHEVTVKDVKSGEAALEYLRKGEGVPALILLDLKLRGMSGIETLRKICSDVRLNKIPVVILTSSSLPSDEKDAYAAGADCYLRKALDFEQFRKDIKALLDCWVPA